MTKDIQNMYNTAGYLSYSSSKTRRYANKKFPSNKCPKYGTVSDNIMYIKCIK